MDGRRVFVAHAMLWLVVACGGARIPTTDGARASSSFDADGGNSLGTSPSGSGSGGPIVEAPAATSAPSLDECTLLGRFPSSAYVPTDDPTEGKKSVVPWMVDPLGEKVPKPKKGSKGKPPPKDPHLDGLRAHFKKCIDTARTMDSAQTTVISFEHRPKGGAHKMCVHVQREEGEKEVTRDLAKCLLEGITEWAQATP